MSKTTSTKTSTFGNDIRALCTELGLPTPTTSNTDSGLPENTGWMFIAFGPESVDSSRALGDTACLIVSKSLTQVHSHIDLDGEEGYIGLPKKNGRVICHFAPDLSLIAQVLHRFVSASRRASITPVKSTGKATPMVMVKATVNTLLVELTDEELDALAPMPAYVNPLLSEMDDEELAEYAPLRH
jgi:hypothetical protein